MTLVLDGSTGVSKVQDGVVTAADLAGDVSLGKVLQVVSATKTTRYSTTSTSYSTIDGLSTTITPTSVNSKILIVFSAKGGSANASSLKVRLQKDGAVVSGALADSGDHTQSVLIPLSPDQSRHYHDIGFQYLDSPSTTNSITYSVGARTTNGGQVVVVNGRVTESTTAHGIATITVMEIAG